MVDYYQLPWKHILYHFHLQVTKHKKRVQYKKRANDNICNVVFNNSDHLGLGNVSARAYFRLALFGLGRPLSASCGLLRDKTSVVNI